MKKKLGNKILLGCLIFALIITTVTSLILGLSYVHRRKAEYEDLLYSYVEAASDFIDGDRIRHYADTLETDEYYDTVKLYLNSIQADSDILYYYVYIPYEDYILYLWDADADVAQGSAKPLGYQEAYMGGSKDDMPLVFRRDPVRKMKPYKTDDYGHIVAAYYPIFDSTGEPVAVVGVDMSVRKMVNDLVSFVTTSVVSILLITILATVVLYWAIQKGVVRPIGRLNRAAQNLVRNLDSDEPFQVDIRTGDEIEELAESFATMNREVRAYISQLAAVTTEKERIGAELSIATHIQSSMLPSIFPAFPERQEFDIFASMAPAKEVGGDFYDFFMVDDRHLAMVVADVSGKGVPAALFMVIAKTLIKDHTVPGEDLGAVFQKVNDLLCQSNSEDFFVTAFEGVLDLVTGELRFVNAGHEVPFLCRKGQGYELNPIRAGFVLAGMEGIRYTAGSLTMEEGDKLFQYTDGVPEATNSDLQLYGMDRLAELLKGCGELSPAQLLPRIKEDVDRFVGDAPQFDDITMLCVEFKKKMEPEA